MNGQECKNAFGKAPESFKGRIAFTLSTVKEEPRMKKFSIRLVLIAAVLLLLMAGVVYAASTEWKILDFVNAWYSKAPTDKLAQAMKESDVRQTFEIGEYVVTLEEAMADGRYLYLTANVRMKNGEEVYFLPMNVSTLEHVCDFVGVHRYSIGDPLGMGESGTDIMGEASSSADDRTFREASAQDGKRLIRANMWVRYGSTDSDLAAFIVLPNGGISFVIGSRIKTDEKMLDVDLHLFAAEVNGDGKYIGKSTNEIVPLHLPVTPVTEEKVVDVGGIPVEGTDVLVDRIEFFLTPLTLHYELYYSAPPSFKYRYGNAFMFNFFNEKEKMIWPGLSLVTTRKRIDDTHYMQIGSLLLDRIPDSLIIQGRDLALSEKYGKVTLNVK